MKTVFICHNYSDNSFASASKYLAGYLSEHGYKVVFLSHKPRELQAFSEGNLTVLPWPVKGRPTDSKAAKFFISTYFKYKPDYIIGHFGGAVISSVLAKMLSFGRVKVYNVYHTLTWQNKLDFDDGSATIKAQNSRRALFYKYFIDLIIAPSNAAKSDYLENWPKKEVNVVYNGYKTIDVAKNIEHTFKKKELLFLGRLDVSKGINQLINGFHAYTTANPNTELKLNLVGQADKEKLPQVQNEKINFEGVVTYDRIPQIISDAYFMITPSLMDNLPTVGIEALSYRTPVVASTKGGWPEIVDDQINGLLIEPTVDDIIKALAVIDNLSLAEYETYCANARKKYESRFTLENYASQIHKMLEQ